MITRPRAADTGATCLARTERRVLAVLARRGRRAFIKDLLAAIDELSEPELMAMLADLHDRGLVSGPSGRLLEYGLTVEGWQVLLDAQAAATRRARRWRGVASWEHAAPLIDHGSEAACCDGGRRSGALQGAILPGVIKMRLLVRVHGGMLQEIGESLPRRLLIG